MLLWAIVHLVSALAVIALSDHASCENGGCAA